MNSPRGIDLLLLAAGLSQEDTFSDGTGGVTETPTVANFEEIEFANNLPDNTFFEGITTIVSSTPIPRSSHLHSFSDPRQIPALDLSISMDETEHPLDLSMEGGGAQHGQGTPLNLVMPKLNASTKISTEKPLNLCVLTPQKQSSVKTELSRLPLLLEQRTDEFKTENNSEQNTATKYESETVSHRDTDNCADSRTSSVSSQVKENPGQDATTSFIRSSSLQRLSWAEEHQQIASNSRRILQTHFELKHDLDQNSIDKPIESVPPSFSSSALFNGTENKSAPEQLIVMEPTTENQSENVSRSGSGTSSIKNESETVSHRAGCADSGTSSVSSLATKRLEQGAISSSVPSTNYEHLQIPEDHQQRATISQNTLCLGQTSDENPNESIPSSSNSLTQHGGSENVYGQLQAMEPVEHGVETEDQRPVLQQVYIDDTDSDSGSETNENATVEALTEHAVSEYFEPYSNQTLISTDESDESDSESEHSSNSEQKVLAASSPSTSVSVGDGSLENHNLLTNPKKRPAWVTRKKRRERGLKYQRTDGTFAPARRIGKPCQCSRLQCNLKYSDKLRSNILKNLLNLSSSGQNQFIGNHVVVKPTARTRVINSRRIATRLYYLPALNGKNRVCKNMFLSTLDIGDKKVRYLAMKTVAHGGICPDDMRAVNRNPHVLKEHEISQIKQHIMSFPSSESHYSREKCAKKFLSSDLSVAIMYELYKEQCTTLNTHVVHYNTYRKVFHTLNLSFRKPRVDTCNTCDEMKTRLRLATEDDKPSIKEELERHHKSSQMVYDKKRSDIEMAKTMDDTCTISFDLQKALATPSLSCGEVFYLRQMYTYNLTIFVTSKSGNEAWCYLWDESQARRGSQEVGSCLFKFLNGLPENIKFVNCYSDRCFGQNCNTIICSMFSAFIMLCAEQEREMTITHNFMVSGHSHMECDSVHSSIERAKKKTSIAIEIPKDWANFIRGIRRKVPFKVVEMELTDFLALKELDQIFKKPTCDSNDNMIKIQKIMCFKYQVTLPGRVEFKYDTTNSTWSEFTYSRANISTVVMPGPINSEPIVLPQAKLDDLRKQLKFIKNKAYYETFLKEIVPKKRGRKSVNHCPDDFEADLDKEFFEEEEINATIHCSESDPLA